MITKNNMLCIYTYDYIIVGDYIFEYKKIYELVTTPTTV